MAAVRLKLDSLVRSFQLLRTLFGDSTHAYLRKGLSSFSTKDTGAHFINLLLFLALDEMATGSFENRKF